MVDYKISKNKGFRYIFVNNDNFGKHTWAIPLKNENSQTIANYFSNILTTSKRKPLKIESDCGVKWYNSFFQNFLKCQNIQKFSRFTEKGPSIVHERVIRTIRNLIKKPVFEKRNADWLLELPYVNKKKNNSVQHSIKTTPVQASNKIKEKEVYSNLQDKRIKLNPKINLGDLVRTSDFRKVLVKVIVLILTRNLIP